MLQTYELYSTINEAEWFKKGPGQGSNQKTGENHLLFFEHKHMKGLYQAMLLTLLQPQL